MAFLEQFSAEDRDLIVSIPYRAGLWVSGADGGGGAKAGHDELDALETIIAEKGRGMFESAFVHEVMAETCTRQQDWKGWAGDLDNILEDCTRAVGIVQGKLAEKDLDAYRMNIMAIGLAVAKAFREVDADAGFRDKIHMQLRLFCDAVMRILRREKYWDPASVLNVSREEDAALDKLSKALYPALDAGFPDEQISSG